MKSIKISIIIFAASLFMLGCNNQTITKNSESQGHHYSDSDQIKLNNGEKWIVNEEMKPFILEAETILIEFIESGSTDYPTLAAQLKEKNSGLIKSCTMTGEGHDELHKWLYPHIELIKELEQEKNLDKANSSIQKLSKSFNTYHQYFQ
jgi:hypothetical protein